MDFDQLVQAFLKLRRDFDNHRHTGLDSTRLRPFEQIEATGSLTAADMSGVDGTYGSEEADVIDNTRTRVNEIANALQQFGILE